MNKKESKEKSIFVLDSAIRKGDTKCLEVLSSNIIPLCASAINSSKNKRFPKYCKSCIFFIQYSKECFYSKYEIYGKSKCVVKGVEGAEKLLKMIKEIKF